MKRRKRECQTDTSLKGGVSHLPNKIRTNGQLHEPKLVPLKNVAQADFHEKSLNEDRDLSVP